MICQPAKLVAKIAWFWSLAALPLMAVSVSATHASVVLALIFATLGAWQRRRINPARLRDLRRLPLPLTLALLLYGWLILRLLFDYAQNDLKWSTLELGLKREAGDLFLLSYGLLIYAQLSTEASVARHTSLRRALGVLVAILILSGSVALFSEFRLSKILTGHPAIASAENRPHHPLGQLKISERTIELYRPVGLLNTRHTYAGMLLLTLPWLLSLALRRDDAPLWRIVALSALIVALALLYGSGSRSSLLAALLVLPLTLFLLRPRLTKFAALLAASLLLIALALAQLRSGAADSMAGSFSMEPIAARIESLRRHTDYQRSILWHGSFELWRENPLFGVGPGRFSQATLAWRSDFAVQHPESWYFLSTTPHGHAHNDLLHLLAVGGVPAGALFLALLFSIVRSISIANPTALEQSAIERRNESRAILTGLVGFFLAGLWQCYFQDDEVTILFWAMLAYTSAQREV